MRKRISLILLVSLAAFCVRCEGKKAEPTALDSPETQPEKKEVPKQFPIIQNGKWGLIDKEGNIVIKPKYGRISGFREGLAFVNVGGKTEHYSQEFLPGLSLQVLLGVGGKWGMINEQEQMVVEPKFDFIFSSRNNLAIVNIGSNHQSTESTLRVGGKWGVIDMSGKVVIPIKYNYMLSFSDGLAVFNEGGKQNWMGIVIGGKWGFIDRTGKTVIEPTYISAQPFKEGLAAVNVGGKYVARTIPGKKAPFEFLEGGKWGFIDTRGKMVIEPTFDSVGSFSEGLIKVKKDSLWGYMDRTGKMVIPPQFRMAQKFSEGLACAKKGSKMGFINRDGKFVITFDDIVFAAPFSEGLSKVGKKSIVNQQIKGVQYGFMDKKGKIVIPFRSWQVLSFEGGLAQVIKNFKLGYIDKTGRYIWKPQN